MANGYELTYRLGVVEGVTQTGLVISLIMMIGRGVEALYGGGSWWPVLPWVVGTAVFGPAWWWARREGKAWLEARRDSGQGK